MRTWRGFARLAWLLSPVLALTSSARAQLFIATPPGEPAVEHAELAYALGDGPPVTWLSLRLAHGPVAVVAALNDGAQVEAGLDAWFEALETTASPHVLLPNAGTDCGESPSLVHVSWPRAQSNPATELSVATAEDVATVLKAVGVSLTSELPGATSYVVWSWPDTEQPQTTRALRAVGGAAPLELSPGGAFPVLLSAITRGAQTYRNEVGKQALDVTFVAGSRRSSDYRARLADFLRERPEPILETRERGMLFDWSIYDDVLSVAPLVHAYAMRAKTDMPELDADACSEQLVALRLPESKPAAACADALDAGLAFEAVAPDLATLQRLALSSAAGVSPLLFAGGGEASAPLLRAKHLDDSACPKPDSEPPIVVVPPARSGGGDSSPAPVVVEERVVVEREPVEVQCGGSPQPEPAEPYDDYDDGDDVDCSSDTSSSSDDETGDDVDCDSDSSSSTASDDTEVDCSSDSSESSDTGDSGCSGDTTSDESGGYDGDTCSGKAAPRAEAPLAQQAALTGASAARRSASQPRPRRLKTSLWSVALAALVLPIRRRKRGQSAGG